MNRLRSQFHFARDDYSRVYYPGDLSTEVLGPISPGHWYKWPVRLGFGGLAAAAAVAWVVLLSRPVVKPPLAHPRSHDDRGPVAVVPREIPGTSLSPPGLPEMPEMPDMSGMIGMPVMPGGFTGPASPPKAPSFIPEMVPLEPPGLPPAMMPPVSHGTSTKEPA